MGAPFASSDDRIGFVFCCFVVGSCDLEDGGTFTFSWLGWSSNPFCLLQSTFNNIMISSLQAPTSNKLGVFDLALQEVQT
jgi:hypothetical protein